MQLELDQAKPSNGSWCRGLLFSVSILAEALLNYKLQLHVHVYLYFRTVEYTNKKKNYTILESGICDL